MQKGVNNAYSRPRQPEHRPHPFELDAARPTRLTQIEFLDGACWAMVTQLEEWAASGGFAWSASLVAKQEGITQMRMEWRPVNRQSRNAKQHRGKRERQPKETKTDPETDIQELFNNWKNSKDDGK